MKTKLIALALALTSCTVAAPIQYQSAIQRQNNSHGYYNLFPVRYFEGMADASNAVVQYYRDYGETSEQEAIAAIVRYRNYMLQGFNLLPDWADRSYFLGAIAVYNDALRELGVTEL